MLPRFERFNAVGEKVYVICKCEGPLDQSKQRRLDEAIAIFDSSHAVFELLPYPNYR